MQMQDLRLKPGPQGTADPAEVAPPGAGIRVVFCTDARCGRAGAGMRRAGRGAEGNLVRTALGTSVPAVLGTRGRRCIASSTACGPRSTAHSRMLPPGGPAWRPC